MVGNIANTTYNFGIALNVDRNGLVILMTIEDIRDGRTLDFELLARKKKYHPP